MKAVTLRLYKGNTRVKSATNLTQLSSTWRCTWGGIQVSYLSALCPN